MNNYTAQIKKWTDEQKNQSQIVEVRGKYCGRSKLQRTKSAASGNGTVRSSIGVNAGKSPSKDKNQFLVYYPEEYF